MPARRNLSDSHLGGTATLSGLDLDDAIIDSTEFTGVLRGCAVTASAGMVLAVSAGVILVQGQRFTINATTAAVGTADASLPRMDAVVAHYYGAVSVVAGTAAIAPTVPATPAGAVLLATVMVPAGDTTVDAGQISDRRELVLNRDERFYDELRWWRSALGNRTRRNANVWNVGDSMSEGFGAPSFDTTFKQLARAAIQQPYRIGAAGFIPAYNAAGMTADVTPGAPANAHIWQFTNINATFPDVGTTFGWGLGRRAIYIDPAGTATLVFWGDAVTVYYIGGSTGTATHIVDGVSQGALNTSTTGGLRTRTHQITGLARGWHTMVVTMSVSAVVLEGAECYDGDRNLGVHWFDGARTGYTAAHFDHGSTDGSDGTWASLGSQMPNPVLSTTGSLTNGSNVLTDAGMTFTARDVGEWVIFDIGNVDVVKYAAAKITGFTDATHVTLDRNATGTRSGLGYRLNRSEVATWSFTSGSAAASSTTAAFTAIDEGKYLVGPAALQPGTYIQRVNSATSVTLSKTATATAGSQTCRILNREAIHASPDLLVVELGINDMTAAFTSAAYKQALLDLVEGCKARCSLDYCSVLLLGLWAPGSNFVNTGFYMSTTNGSNVITLANYPEGYFTSDDIGKTVSALGNPAGAPTGFAATVTISSVAADGRTAVASANATSTQTGVANQIVARQWSDQGWQPYRKAMRDLAAEQGYAFWDLYEMGGWIGKDDRYGLTTDGTHPSQHGAQWIADQLNEILTGMPKTASIPVGVFNSAGEMIIAQAADAARVVPGVRRKVTADTTTGAVAGVMTDITELAFQIGPNETLGFLINLFFRAAAITSGILFDFSPAANVSAPADLVMSCIGPSATGGANQFQWYGRNDAAWGTDLSILGAGPANQPTIIQITGGVTGGAYGGLITPRFGPEAAAAITLERGSWSLTT